MNILYKILAMSEYVYDILAFYLYPLYNLLIEQQFFIIDFDSTFVTIEALDELANIALTNNPQKEILRKEIAEITKQAMEGTLSFSQALESRLSLFRGDKSHIQKLIPYLKDHITPSIARNKSFFQEYADRIYILSGGFQEYIQPIIKDFGIENTHLLANTFLFGRNGEIIGYDKSNPLAQDNGKIQALKHLELVGNIIVIGDGYTDYQIKEQGFARRFYAFIENTNRSSVTAKADEVLFSFDEFLYMYNFPRTLSYPKSKIKVLLFEHIHPLARDLFTQEGYIVEKVSDSCSQKELLEKIHDVSILGVSSYTAINAQILDHSKKLLSIGIFGLEYNNIDIAYAAKKGVVVFNSPHSNTRSVVELIIGEIIMLSRRIFEKSVQMHAGIWNENAAQSHEIRGKKLGIIGYGHVGAQLSLLAETLGMDVFYYDIEDTSALGHAQQCESLEEVLRMADIIAVTVDTRPENINLIGKKEFALMKSQVILVSASHESVFDMTQLYENLSNGKIAGCALDRLPHNIAEKPGSFSSPLQNIPNVILTPQFAGSSVEAKEQAGAYISEKIINFINSGNTLRSVNFPQLQLPKQLDQHRLIHIHQNVPGVLATINSTLAKHTINIEGQYLKTNEHIGYVITDIKKSYSKDVISELKKLPETIKLRMLY